MGTHTTDHIDLIDSGAAAEILDISHRALMRLVKLKRIPHYALPGDVKFDRGELLAWLRTQYQPAEGSPQ